MIFIMNELNEFIEVKDKNPLLVRGIEYWMYISDLAFPNLQERYLISSFGRVFSKPSNSFLSLQYDSQGLYLRITLTDVNRYRTSKLIHRLVMITFCPIIGFENLQINHIDGNKLNNDIFNLEWVTSSENIRHAFRTGLMITKFGEEVPWASITNDQADQIGQLLSLNQYTYPQIASMINCSVVVIKSIANGKSWLEVYQKYNLDSVERTKSRLFTDEQAMGLCEFFCNNDNSIYGTIKNYCKYALLYIGFPLNEITEEVLEIVRYIYNRDTYKDISRDYNFKRSETIES